MANILNLPDLRPALLLDFANSASVDPRIAVSRASTASRLNSSGVLEIVPTGAPRIDYDAVAAKCLGLRVDGAATNLVANNGTAGAVAGVLGSGGSLPTGWSAPTANGLTCEVLAVGVEDGIPYVDVHFYGTATTTYQALSLGNVSGYAPSTTYTASVYAKLLSGAIPASGSVQFKIRYNHSAGSTDINGTYSNSNFVTDKLRANRLSTTGATSSASTGAGQLLMVFNYSVGTVIDFSLRIGLPQLEAGGGATSPILTTGSAVTRAAEHLALTLPDYSDITVLTEYQLGSRLNDCRAAMLYASANNAQNIAIIAANSSGTASAGVIASSGGVNTSQPLAAVAGRTDRVAFTRKAGGAMLVSSRGQTLVAGAHTGVTEKLNTLSLGGTTPAGLQNLNGYVRRVAVWFRALTQAELNKITEVSA